MRTESHLRRFKETFFTQRRLEHVGTSRSSSLKLHAEIIRSRTLVVREARPEIAMDSACSWCLR